MMNNANNNKRKLSTHYKVVSNAVKISKQPTFLHEIVKACVCKILKDKNKVFTTEAIFTEYLRADVYNLTDDHCYEIVHSESDESIEIKRKIYPVLELIQIKTKDYEKLTLSQLKRKLEEQIL